MPPPPVCGGTAGNVVGDGDGEADGDADGDGLGEEPGEPLGEAPGDELALGLALEPGAAAPGELPLDADGIAGALLPGEDLGSVAEDEEVVQAEMATEASKAASPQLMAADRPLNAVLTSVACNFMKPPRNDGGHRGKARGRPGNGLIVTVNNNRLRVHNSLGKMAEG